MLNRLGRFLLMVNRLGRFLVRMMSTPARELIFIVGFIGFLSTIFFLGQLLAGQAGARAACFVGMGACALLFGVLINHSIRQKRREALRQKNNPSLAAAGPPPTIWKRFQNRFLTCFAGWTGSWVSLWIGATVYAFVSGRANQGWFMISLEGWIALLLLIDLGIPLSLVFAGISCWFRNG